jgi:predicted acylesterase/phospholipase RssA
LRSYAIPEDAVPVTTDAKNMVQAGDLQEITIDVASRATSAAPTYLPQVDWKGLSFWDGGLLNNNPINQLWDNRYDLVKQHELAPTVSVVVSLGTSWSTPKKPGLLRLVNLISKASSFMTNVEAKHRDFKRYLNRVKGRVDQNANTMYYRFNTPTEKLEISLHEYLKIKDLKDCTTKYLALKTTQDDILACAKLLVGI